MNIATIALLLVGVLAGCATPPPGTSTTLYEGARLIVGQTDEGVRVSLQVQPPGGMALVPAVHGQRDEVGPVFDVTDDDVALLS